jgi:hypothetical protein
MRNLALFTAGLLAFLMVSCGPPMGRSPASNPPASDNESVSEAVLIDAGFYAKQEGVSLDEAVRRFKLMDLAGPLGAALEKNESATLAGHWLEHQPEFKVVVVFTRDGEETIKKYVSEDSPLWSVLDVRTAEGQVTEEQLQAEQHETMALLDKLSLFCDSDTDIKKGQINVYVTDSRLFNETLEKAGAKLPPHVVPVVVYEPLYGPPPFPVNPDPSIHFPQMKILSMAGMLALMVGDLVVKDGYLYVGDSLIVWQPDYFVNSNNGTIEILNRDGNVVAREWEELVMGGGNVPADERLNRMLKEPLGPGIAKSVWVVQADGPRLSLNFNSELFGLDVIMSGDREFEFLTVRPQLDRTITQKITFTGRFSAGTQRFRLKSPAIFSDSKPEENKTSVQYTTFWPSGYTGRVTDGVFEVVDASGNVAVRDGDTVKIEGRALYDFNWQLSDELPGGLNGPHLIVDRVVR